MSVPRNFGLDLLRAAAITMVFLSHGVSALDTLGVGVDLFFVLSGFLIGRIYFRAESAPANSSTTSRLWNFWTARWLRTLPPYFAALLLYALLQLRFHNNAVGPAYLLFLQNYAGVQGFGPSWSLCVEEHFYLILPLAGFLLLRTVGTRALRFVLPLLALVPQVLRLLAAHSAAGLPQNWYWRTHLHAEGLILGVWLALVFLDCRDGLWSRLRLPALLLAPLPLALLVYQHRFPVQPRGFQITVFLLYAIGYSAWLRLAYDLRWTPVSAFARVVERAVRGLALASYSIYLVHTLLFADVRVLIDAWPRGPVKTGTILLSTLVLAALFYFAVERPAIHLRDRLLAPKVPQSEPQATIA